LLVKTFQGSGFPAFMAAMRRSFGLVVSRKPGASRGRSAEMYLLGKGFRVSETWSRSWAVFARGPAHRLVAPGACGYNGLLGFGAAKW